ncbi:hypothetical protein DCAR_0519126 [Daucus carota subsp. sativus]|uniref:TFIIS N-terminal domain-containing protein n=2 Tax=Daucus carota subsp. sativus TaxID=79200 RepID=A0AAF0X0Y1_DAUCS|nr:hypothetical protein DCAR_0519126 [Daucus carota subsp. sativus]
MTLEDFFTLTEMKNGLSAPARMKELINVMQKDKHNIVKNVGDASRQWYTVARTIATTDSKDCLALFIQLDGLCYFDTWLKDGQKYYKETGDSFVEELLATLLVATGKLHIDEQKSVTSGIMNTVKDLLTNKSSIVHDKAKALLDSWKQNDESNVVPDDAEIDEKVCDDHHDLEDVNENPDSKREQPECSSLNISNSGGNNSEEKNAEPSVDEVKPEICPEAVHPDGIVESTVQPLDKSSNHASPDPGHSTDTSKLISGISSVLENPATHISDSTGIESSGSAVPEQRTLERHLDVANPNEDNDAKQLPQIKSCDKLGATDSSFGADSSNTVESKVGANMEKDFDAKKEDPSPKLFSYGDARKQVSEGKGEMGDSRSSYPCSKLSVSNSTAPVDVLQDSSFSKHDLGKNEDLTTNLSGKEDTEAIEESNDQSDTDEDEVDLGNDYGFSMSGVNVKDSVDKKSDFELEYSMFDPLEVARQVAMEVEREVDCREPSCSSSERTSGGRMRLAESPDSIHGKNSRVHNSYKDVSVGTHLSAVVRDEAFVKAKNQASEQENCTVDAEPSGATEVDQTTEPVKDKRVCGFDLNEEMLSDDNEISPVSAPISVVSASRAAAASGLPLSPLQFEGTLGWKGSAETSAFRPAPTRKVSGGENFILASGSSSNLFQRQQFLDFDLNVAEDEDDKISELTPNKDIQNSTGCPSEKCSLETSPKKSDLSHLDLNRVGDGSDVPISNWKKETRLLPLWHGQFSQSPSSSSSSMQPSLKNFDLNDQPSLFTPYLDPASVGRSSSDFCTSGSGGVKPDKSVISLMGARVEVNQNEIVPQTGPLSNSRFVKHALDGSMPSNDSYLGLGSSTQYAHSSTYGYNGRSSGSGVPFSSPMYGLGSQFPYMMDSRGSPVVPQVLGSVPALHPSMSQPSFFMSLASAPSEYNGFVPSRNGPDLNSGLMMDRGNRDASTRQLFNPGHGILIDEQMRANSQSTSSSGVGGKRKETDGGWDLYPFNYKHHQPPWK